ncbi:MAG: hypothetical protein JSY10_14820 [Paenibacillus sp.]|nr:hypothetical protein [Paenibacillus sp.]
MNSFWEALKDASEVVEYVSWVTASIFAIVAVLSIFLAFQFQMNITESGKLIWKLKETIRNKKVENFEIIKEEFLYVHSKVNIVSNIINITRRVIWGIIIVWSISCLSMLARYSVSENYGFNIIRLVLILMVSVIFIYYVVKFSRLIKVLSVTEAEKNRIFTQNDLFDSEKLISLNCNRNDIVALSKPSFHFLLMGENPYVELYIRQTTCFNNFKVALSINNDQSSIIVIGQIKSLSDNQTLAIDSSITRERINKFFSERVYIGADISISVLIGEEFSHYKGIVYDSFSSNNYHNQFVVNIGELITNSWSPPIRVIEALKNEKDKVSVYHF